VKLKTTQISRLYWNAKAEMAIGLRSIVGDYLANQAKYSIGFPT
jgi:hypothetical protein